MQTRKPNRLPAYDYSAPGTYFITICVKDKRCILSSVVGGGVPDAPQDTDGRTISPPAGGGVPDAPQVQLTEFGKIVDRRITEMNGVYSDLCAEKYVIMPNHVHLLLTIQTDASDGSSRTPTPTNARLSAYVSTFKRMTNRAFGEAIWQRGFYDHVIRDDREYAMCWQYIDENPKKWLMGKDEYYA